MKNIYMMKQCYLVKSNALKQKLWTFILLALLLGGENAFAQGWHPTYATTAEQERVFYLITDPSNNTQFYVYRNGIPSSEIGPYTHIEGFDYVDASGQSPKMKVIFCTTHPVLFRENGSYGGMTIYTTSDFQLTFELGENVNLQDVISNPGSGVTIPAGTFSYSSNITLKIDNATIGGTVFGIFNLRRAAGSAECKKFIVKGLDPQLGPNESDTAITSYGNRQFVIDGGSNVNAVPDGNTYKSQFSGNAYNGSLFRLETGTMELKNVTIQNYWDNLSGNAVVFFNNGVNNTACGAILKMDHCLMKKCAGFYPGVMLQFTTTHPNSTASTIITRCYFTECVGEYRDNNTINSNAPVRSLSGSRSSLVVSNCTSFNNKGGGMRWQSVGTDPAIFNNCLLKDNICPENGGGFYLKAGASLNGCVVTGNRTNGKGGGIFYTYFEEMKDSPADLNDFVYSYLKPRDAILRMNSQTVITNNTAASHGGGMAVETTLIAPEKNFYYYSFTPGGAVTGEFLNTEFHLEGATITGNTSGGNGGGVYISRAADAFCYGTSCYLKYGIVKDNHADNGNGGGVYIYSSDEIELSNSITHATHVYGTNYPSAADFKPKDLKVVIGMDNDESNKMEISENTSQKGAGVYVEGYDLPLNGYTSKVTLDMFNYSEVFKNIATSDGGGIYVYNGKVSIMKTQDTRKPTIGGADATYANIAGYGTGNGNGGGLYLNTGDIVINQGVINFNEATLEGGGLYVNNGNVNTDVETTEPVNVPTPTVTLPEGFQQVEWIASAGTAYIQTTIPVSGQHTIYAIGARNISSSFFVGCGNATNNRIGAQFNGATWQYYWRINDNIQDTYGQNLSYDGININNPTQFVMNKTGVWLSQNNTVVSRTYNGSSANMSGQFWRLFKTNGNNAYAKIFEAKIYDADAVVDAETGEVTEGTLRGDFIPCYRTVNGTITIGMFDLVAYAADPDRPVQEYFLTNAASSGSFTKGPDVFDGRSLGAGVITDAATGVSTDAATIGTRALTGGCEVSYNTAGTNGGGICLKRGNIFLLNSTIDENVATDGNGGGVYDDEGLIFVNYWNPSDPGNIENLIVRGETTATKIRSNFAGGNGGGLNTHLGQIFMRGQTPTQDIIIANNTASTGSGGGIFCMGSSDLSDREQIRLINVNLHDNKAVAGNGATNDDGVVKGCGGGVYLQHGTINITKCELTNNTAHINGGGINNHGGTINVKGCLINDNEAGKDNGNLTDICSGGGIFTVQGDVNLNNYMDGLSEYHRTEIVGNSAKSNGGGITTRQGKVTAIGEYTADRSKCILINDNEASEGSGGGVFCLGVANSNAEYILLRNVDMENNQAVSGSETTQVPIAGGSVVTVSNGCGGGIYLQEGIVSAINVKINNNFANVNGGGINNHRGNINIEGCPITNNKADNSGGGIYTNEGDVDLQDHIVNLEGSLNHLETVVDHNEAQQNGGGIDTKKGIITINFNKTTNLERETDHQIEVTNNRAKKGGGIYANAGTIIAANAKIDNNFASENGGGINNHAGDITLYGGSLNNNTAQQGKGGGAFTYVGDIKIQPFPVDWSDQATQPTLNDGTMIYNNIANLNGGGLNNHTGRIDIRHARLKNNTSTLGNGGGIFCEGPHTNSTGFTIRLFCSELVQNKTRGQDGTAADPTGRGGGIYLKYGSIYAHASDILLNSANINGGGLDNHNGKILVYGCKIVGNTAVTGSGGGIYTQTGDITTGPCLARDNSGKSQATIIQSNVAQQNGGGINNHHGNIFLNGDFIGGVDNSNPSNPISLGNIAEKGHGGGIYIADGIIDMYGGRIAYNVAAKGDGGGVYSGGGEFNIQKRQGKPIVEIVDVDPQANGDVTIHYHVIDKGGNSSTTLDDHGIYWGEGTPGTQVSFGASGYTSITGESGCFRITIPSTSVPVSDEQTYKVKAYATNKTSQGGDPEEFVYLTDESEEMDFVPYSSIPVVITGSVNEVTAIHAEVYAKIIYDGGASITGRGVYCAPSAETPSEGWVQFTSDETGDFFLTEITNNNNANPGDTVYVKAYATNSNNVTGYGEIITFITPKDLPNMGNSLVDVTEITSNDALFSFTMPDGTDWSTIKAYGFVISTDDDPEIHADGNHTLVVTSHSDNTFSMKASDHTPNPIELNPGTTYYVRAFATKIENAGTDVSNYAVTTPKQFVTRDANDDPVIRAVEISGITRNGATITGKIVYKGGSDITNYGVCWSQSNHHPDHEHCTDLDWDEATPNGPDPSTFDDGSTFSLPLPDTLKPNSTYYIRIYATNGRTEGEPAQIVYVYSNDFNFTTLPVTPPTVKLEVIDIDRTTATVKCTVNDGGHGLTSYGVKWKKASDPDFTDAIGTNLGTGGNPSNVYTIDLTSLEPNTQYIVKAYAANGTGANNDGTGSFEGREITFTTSYNKPNPSDVTVNSITYNPAQTGDDKHKINVKGSATPNETGQTIEHFGFVYSVNPNPTMYSVQGVDEWDCGYEEVSPYVADQPTDLKSNVNPNKIYYVRAYASSVNSPTSDADYKYGNDTTILTLPEVIAQSAMPTNNSAQLTATINHADLDHHLRHIGVCWNTSGDPTIANSNTGVDIVSSTPTATTFTFSTPEDLTSGSTYFWRAFAWNENYDDDPESPTYNDPNCIAYSNQLSFTPYQYKINLEVVPPDAGTLTGQATVAGTGYFTGSTGYVNSVTSGENITLTALSTNSSNYQVEMWTYTDGGSVYDTVWLEDEYGNPYLFTNNDYSFNPSGNFTYTVWYKSRITFTAGSNGSVSGTVGGNTIYSGDLHPYGTNITLTAFPATDYVVDYWEKDGETVVDDNGDPVTTTTLNITVEAAASYKVYFKQNRRSASLNSGSRPRDIYPAPAREPWDWDDITGIEGAMTDTVPEVEDEALREVRERLSSDGVIEPEDIPHIIENQATEGRGGGVFVAHNEDNPSKIRFSGGQNEDERGKINNNYAKLAGGGVYISLDATLFMRYYCEVNNNHVDAIVNDGKQRGGGGIYLGGILKVGENPDDAEDIHSLKVDGNWAGVELQYEPSLPNVNNRNNVYLPEDPIPLPESESWNALNGLKPDGVTPLEKPDKQRVITLLSNIAGKYDEINPSTGATQTTYYTRIGISVDHGFRGVIYTPMKAGTPEDHGDETLSHEKWLIDLIPSQGGALESAFFDDANMYYALHVQNVHNPDDLKRQYDYLYGCWTTAVRVDPNEYTDKFPLPEDLPGHFTIDEHDTWHIYTKYGLAWFTSWVNGLNGNVGHPDAKAFIERDMDMREHIWIPIGTTEPYPGYGTEITFRDGGAYVGEFNGQGHLITGLQCRYATGVKKYGLFGTVSKSVTIKKLVKNDQGQITESGELITVDGNGIVKNTFVDDYRYWTFRIGEQETYAYKIGGIAGEVAGGGTVCASEARGLINIPECVPDQSYVGGLVGKMEGTAAVPAQGENPAVPEMPAVVHSSMAMPEIKGMAKYVGGLVGYLGATDNLLNSFSNSKFTGSPYNNSITVGSTETVYFGGLVGVNDGTVENCYSRLQGNEPTNGTTSIFGWLAGTSNNANIKYCYAAEGKSTAPTEPGINNGGVYKRSGTDPSNHGTYSKTERYSGKYGFKHRDHKITAADANTTLLVTDIDATGLTNQPFGNNTPPEDPSSNNSNNQPTTLSTLSGGLITILDAWVDKPENANKGYTNWTRTMASPINDDYPVPMLTTKNNTEKFNSVGSIDCIYLLYEDNVNAMWTGDNGKHFDTITGHHPHAAMYLYDVQPILNAATDNTPAIYDTVYITGNTNVPLYINEDVGITQPDGNPKPKLIARAGVTIRNARADESNPNWHLFSSAIEEVPIGIQYNTSSEQGYIDNIVKPGTQSFGHEHDTWADRNKWDPPMTSWLGYDSQNLFNYKPNSTNNVGYFPTNTPYGTWRPGKPEGHTASQVGGFFDLYEYNEYYYHWINYKREGTDAIQDHWHWDQDFEDKKHYRIGYDKEDDDRYFNDVTMPAGKGYLMALSSESMMMADGILNTGDISAKVTQTSIGENLPPNGHGSNNYTVDWRKLNMIGNPYQSYLDFDKFVENTTNQSILDRLEYAVADDSQGPEQGYRYVYYTATQSNNWPYTASRYIHPHQGFFVKVKSNGSLEFKDDMRVAGKIIINNVNNKPGNDVISPYRGDRNYPLVNLLCYDEDGKRDLTTVEVNRPEFGGGHKMEKLHESKGLIYAHLQNESFQTLFTPMGINVVPVRFVPSEDGVFTLNWNTRHGVFSYLHLIDNMTGVDVDCLTNSEYRFESKTTDYRSRFKLVFRCEGDEDPDEPDEPEGGDDDDHFAFFFEDELIVNGEGLLQVFDIQGRCLLETQAIGPQSRHRLPRVAAGVYLLRLAGDKKVKIQKMVI